MPQIGLCTDLTCDQDIKRLYECYCCSRLICLDHLNEHVKVSEKNNKKRGSSLLIVTTTLQSIVEKKLIDIQREEILLVRAKKILEAQVYSIDDIEQIYEQVNQAIASNRSSDTEIKVESSLSNVNHCLNVWKDETKQHDHNNGVKLESLHLEEKSPTYLSLVRDEDDEETAVVSTDKDYTMSSDDSFASDDSLQQTDHCFEDDDGNNEIPAATISTFYGQCPLVFDGAYGLDKSKHFIRLCSKKKLRPLGLHAHFMSKHRFKSSYARQLVQAVMNKKNPKTTKIFVGNEDIINHAYKTPCPFHKGKIELPDYDMKKLVNVPCRNQAVIAAALLPHLKRHHKVPKLLARILVNRWKKTQKRQ